MKNKYHIDFSEKELEKGYKSMLCELKKAPSWLLMLFNESWSDFKKNKFSYDGATFVKELKEDTIFEVGAFIHDRFNGIGYVGYCVDFLFIEIMILLKYPKVKVITRSFLMVFTFVNILRHFYFKEGYIGDVDLIKLKKQYYLNKD